MPDSPDKPPHKPLKRLRTGALSRRWELSKASMRYGRRAMTQALRDRMGDRESPAAQTRRRENIDAFVRELGQLKGSIVKVGQIMATYGDYLMPPEVVQALSSLEDNTPAMEWQAIERVLRRELGEEKLVELDVDPRPVAAASLGQVHRGVIRETGEMVCLKVQYPGVDKTIDADFNDLIRMFRLFRVLESTRSVEDWFSDIRNLLHREVDYRFEAEELRFAREHLADDSRFVVPAVFERYCTRHVVCMSWEEGLSFKHERVAALPQSTRNALGEAILELFLTELYDWQRMQTDPNFGNYRVRLRDDGGAQLILLDFGAIRPLPDDFVSDFRRMVESAYHNDKTAFLERSVTLGFMKADYPAEVLDNFADIGMDILEPLKPRSDNLPSQALTDGEYDWRKSQLPKRIAKRALAASISRYFALPPKEFLYVMRKLMGVYALVAALDARFFADHLLRPYLRGGK